jgi:ABC-2 type transport system permease protein
MRKLPVVLRKEFLQIRRNPFVLRLLLIAPVVQLVLLGYAATLDVKSIPVVFCDGDHSVESRRLADLITASGYFVEAGRVDSPAAIFPYLDSGRAGAAVVIPVSFQNEVRAGKAVQLQAFFDGANSNEATQARAYLTSIVLNQNILAVSRQGTGVLSVQEGKPPRGQSRPQAWAPIEPRIRVWYNETLNSSHFMVPGVIAMILMVLTVTMTAVSLVREKEAGTLTQILATPLPAHVFLLGKLLPFVIIGLFDVALVLATGRLVFGTPMRGSVLLLYALSLLFVTTTLGFGLLVSTLASTQQQALVGSYAVVGPNLLLAGFVFPIENMPAAIRMITYLLPMRYFLTIIRGILLKGVGLETLWPSALALGGYALASFGMSVWLFARQKAQAAGP